MKFGVVRFPGSNCDQDCIRALHALGQEAEYVWHKETTLDGLQAILLSGGFSYGDYLRCGSIARFSPVMKSVIEAARGGTLVIGICNGFQILCEAGLLPGALMRNRDLRFICAYTSVRVETDNSPFTSGIAPGRILRIPIAHGEGRYFANAETLEKLNRENRVLLRYCDSDGNASEEANPNGSLENIAGICNAGRNVFGLMPHPERAFEDRLGSSDGRLILESMIDAHAGAGPAMA